MLAVKVPHNSYVHIAYRQPHSSVYNRTMTACLMENEGEELPHARGMTPDCPFCIRDGVMPRPLRRTLAERIGLTLEEVT